MRGQITIVAVVAALLTITTNAHAQRFTPGEPVVVRINYDSFLTRGFSESQRVAVQNAVINAYTRWQMVGGVDLEFRFGGYTSRPTGYRPGVDSPGDFYLDNEIIVFMGDYHDGRLASFYSCETGRGGPSRCGQLVIMQRPSETGTPYIWRFWGSSEANTFDLEAVLMHELGHAHDLPDDYSNPTSVMSSYNFWNGRFGPSRADRDSAAITYGAMNRHRIRIHRATDVDGASYSLLADLPGNVRTTMDPAAVRNGSRLIYFYTGTGKTPCFIHGSTSGAFGTSKWWCWGGSSSHYGIAADGDDNETMWSFVERDGAGDPMIKVVYSTRADLDSGTGVVRALPLSRSYGTPAIAKVGTNTWLLAYSRFSRGELDDTGVLVGRISTNDGASWSSEVELRPSTYRIASGVSAAANRATGEVRLGYAWAATPSGFAPGQLIRTLRARVAGASLADEGMLYGSEATRTQPVLSRASSRYHLHLRDMSANTWIRNLRSTLTGDWMNDTPFLPSSQTATTAALAADPALSFTYTFQTQRL